PHRLRVRNPSPRPQQGGPGPSSRSSCVTSPSTSRWPGPPLPPATPSPNWSGHLGEVMLNLFEEEENGGISQGRRWAPAVHDRLQEGADRPRPPGRDYAFGACA